MKKNHLLSVFLVAILIAGLTFACHPLFRTVHASPEVIGEIASDTTWTKADGPYDLTGPVKVNNGVTLTVEPGTVVNLNSFYILVQGTLNASGTNSDNIQFNGGSNVSPDYALTFVSSTEWDEKKATGCIVENAILSSIFISDASPMIRNNSISALFVVDIDGGSPKIYGNFIQGQISVHRGSSLIVNNTIVGKIEEAPYASATISGNIMEGAADETGILVVGNTNVTDNILLGYGTGISAFFGVSTITRNLIAGNVNGIVVGSESYEYDYIVQPELTNFNVTVQNNAVVNNSMGIKVQYYPPNPQYPITVYENVTPTIINNNIQGNYNYSIYLNSTLGLNATNNWWGTTDAQAINQTIYDNKRDFNLATVNFTPFLTQPDPEASAVANKPFTIQNPSPSTEPTNPGNPPLPEVQIQEIIIAALVVVIIVLIIILVWMRGKNQAQNKNTT